MTKPFNLFTRFWKSGGGSNSQFSSRPSEGPTAANVSHASYTSSNISTNRPQSFTRNVSSFVRRFFANDESSSEDVESAMGSPGTYMVPPPLNISDSMQQSGLEAPAQVQDEFQSNLVGRDISKCDFHVKCKYINF